MGEKKIILSCWKTFKLLDNQVIFHASFNVFAYEIDYLFFFFFLLHSRIMFSWWYKLGRSLVESVRSGVWIGIRRLADTRCALGRPDKVGRRFGFDARSVARTVALSSPVFFVIEVCICIANTARKLAEYIRARCRRYVSN